jgi:hypothetical protein
MNFRILQFPRQNSRVIRLKTFPLTLTHPYAFAKGNGFLSSWHDDASPVDGTNPSSRINWGAIYGIALSLAVSAGFWVGVGVMIGRLWK